MPRRKKEPERRRGAVVVRGGGGSDRRTEDQKLLRSRQPIAGFQETDTWRTLRIMGEFVEGFDALAEVGPAVSIFGSARIKPGEFWYEQTVELAIPWTALGLSSAPANGPSNE